MARLAEMAERMDPRQLSRISGLALALALGLVAVVLMPVLIAVGWAILSAIGSAAGLTSLVQGIVNLLTLVLNVFESLIQSVQAFLSANPGLLLVMLGLIPVSLIGLLRILPRRRATTDVS
jgi:glucan phosphoethanolaminetransferase (alkaline phosphatase superfamily)